MKKIAGIRVCSRCGVAGEHGAGQTYCKVCHREIARLAAPAGVRECTGCGSLAEFSAGASRCKDCRAAAGREQRARKARALLVVKEAFQIRVSE